MSKKVLIDCELLQELVSSLEGEVESRYSNGIKEHPAMKRDYECDIEPVIRGKELLAAAPSPWVSVEDLLPEDETDVLVRGEYSGQDIFTVAGRFYGDWMSQETEEIISFEPTHWMPLPTPPEKSE